MEWFSGGGRIDASLKHAGDEEGHPCSMISERCACGCDSSGHTVSARREDRSHARDTSAQGQAGRRGIAPPSHGLQGLFFGRRPWRARARARPRWRPLLALAHLRCPQRRPCLINENAAHTCHLALVVEGHLGCTWCPICGTRARIQAPARPATDLRASEQPTAKPEDLPR